MNNKMNKNHKENYYQLKNLNQLTNKENLNY